MRNLFFIRIGGMRGVQASRSGESDAGNNFVSFEWQRNRRTFRTYSVRRANGPESALMADLELMLIPCRKDPPDPAKRTEKKICFQALCHVTRLACGLGSWSIRVLSAELLRSPQVTTSLCESLRPVRAAIRPAGEARRRESRNRRHLLPENRHTFYVNSTPPPGRLVLFFWPKGG